MNPSTSPPSPLSPTRWPDDAFRPLPTLGFALLLAAAAIVPATVLMVALVVGNVITTESVKAQTLTPALFVVQLVGYALPVLLLFLLLPRLAHRSLADLGLRAPARSDLLWGVLGAVAMLIAADAVGAIQAALFHVKTEEVQVQWLARERGPMVAAFAFLAVVLAPFFEELTFRGFLFNALLRFMPVAVSAVLAGLIFGLIHYQAGNAGAILPLAAGGIVLCAVYYRSGSLIASMISHGLFNSFTVVAVIFFHITT